MRTNNGQIAYMTSEDGGDNWGETKFLDFIYNPDYGTQLSIINHAQYGFSYSVLTELPNHYIG